MAGPREVNAEEEGVGLLGVLGVVMGGPAAGETSPGVGIRTEGAGGEGG